MLTKKQLNEIRTLLKKSENPLFFFDDDGDGLSSFLLLYKYIEKGKGITMKTAKEDTVFLKKVDEYRPDIIFMLDRPIVSQEFIDKARAPVILIDHHPPIKRKNLKYFNPRLKNPKCYIPVSEICYKITKQNLWIASCGIISDYTLNETTKKFSKKYPDLLPRKIKDPGDALFKTKIGNIIRILSFMLKPKTSEVNKAVSILTRIDDPYEILNKTTPRARYLFKTFEKVDKKYNILLNKAINSFYNENILLFTYPSSKMSFTGDLATELSYKFPDKIILIAREKDSLMRISIRTKSYNLPKLLNKALKGLDGNAGGHEQACGGFIAKKDFNKFVKNLEKLTK